MDITLQRNQIAEWCARMEENPGTLIVLSNIMFDYRNGRVPPTLLCEFLCRLADAWATKSLAQRGPGNHPSQALKTFKEVRDQMDDGQLEIDCQGEPVIACTSSCSTVIPDVDFKRTIDPVWLTVADEGFVSDAELQELEKQASLAERFCATATMPPSEDPNRKRAGKSKHLMWVTPTDRLTRLREMVESDRLAMRVQCSLGLFHHFAMEGEATNYVEIVYPDDFFSAASDDGPRARLAPPTVFDSRASFVYRSQHGPEGWGLTVDLDSLQDGLPEAVHLQIPLRGGFRMRRVGMPGGHPEVTVIKLLAAIPEADRWKRDDLAALQALCR